MVFGRFLVALGVCSLVLVQAETTENDLRDLVLQLQTRLDKLEKECADRAPSIKVAFSASLHNEVDRVDFGPYRDNTTLRFRRVVTNIGNAYDNNTGIFTAPVKGLYYLGFTGNVGNSGTLNAALLKNGVNMFAIYNKGNHTSGTNSMALVMKEGEYAWISLSPGSAVYDQSRRTTFSGFLIHTL